MKDGLVEVEIAVGDGIKAEVSRDPTSGIRTQSLALIGRHVDDRTDGVSERLWGSRRNNEAVSPQEHPGISNICSYAWDSARHCLSDGAGEGFRTRRRNCSVQGCGEARDVGATTQEVHSGCDPKCMRALDQSLVVGCDPGPREERVGCGSWATQKAYCREECAVILRWVEASNEAYEDRGCGELKLRPH